MKVLIIGGGPAGSTAARLLAKEGFDTTLIQDKIWDKPCGGGVKTKIFEQFQIPKSLIKHTLSKVEIIYKNKIISIPLKGKNLSIVFRYEFDQTLRDLAQKDGAKLYYGKFGGFEQEKAVVKIKNEKILFEYDILIAADGVNSSVRKALNLPPIPKTITHYSKTNKYKTEVCEFFFEQKYGGEYYGWAFPHGDLTHIGSVDAKSFKNLCEYLKVKEKPKGYFIPTWRENIIIQKNNIYFVGDAAGQVMPLSFEGIYYAIKSAEILANSIISQKDYKKEWEKRFLKQFKFMKRLENLMKNALFRDIMVKAHNLKFVRNFSVNLWLGKV